MQTGSTKFGCFMFWLLPGSADQTLRVWNLLSDRQARCVGLSTETVLIPESYFPSVCLNFVNGDRWALITAYGNIHLIDLTSEIVLHTTTIDADDPTTLSGH